MYPHHPGHRGTDTSEDAGKGISSRAQTLRQQCLEVIKDSQGLTADEVAERLRESVLAIRPRITELGRMGRIRDSGGRRVNISGKNAIVWVVSVKQATDMPVEKTKRQGTLFDISKDGSRL